MTCKDCIHFRKGMIGYWCQKHYIKMGKDDYCSKLETAYRNGKADALEELDGHRG